MSWTEQEYNCQKWSFIQDLIVEFKKQSKEKL